MKKQIGLLNNKKNLKTKENSNRKKVTTKTRMKTMNKTMTEALMMKEPMDKDAKMLKRKSLRGCVNSSYQNGLTNLVNNLKI